MGPDRCCLMLLGAVTAPGLGVNLAPRVGAVAAPRLRAVAASRLGAVAAPRLGAVVLVVVDLGIKVKFSLRGLVLVYI